MIALKPAQELEPELCYGSFSFKLNFAYAKKKYTKRECNRSWSLRCAPQQQQDQESFFSSRIGSVV